MTTMSLEKTERTLKSNGQYAEQCIAYTLTHEVRTPGNVPFNVDSDIPEYHMSVKSSKASLMSATYCKSNNRDKIIQQFITESVATCFAYVIADFSKAYIMDAIEFTKFLENFSYLTKESEKNGGGTKVRIYAESKKMLAWLEGQR